MNGGAIGLAGGGGGRRKGEGGERGVDHQEIDHTSPNVCSLTVLKCEKRMMITVIDKGRGSSRAPSKPQYVKVVFLTEFTPNIPAVGSCGRRNLKSYLVRAQSLNVFPLRPKVGQYIVIHATLTARDFFLAYFYPSGPFTSIFFQNFSRFFRSCVGPQSKIGHPAGCRFP